MSVTTGAVVYVQGLRPRFFCFRARDCLRASWQDRDDQVQLVLQAEFSPLVVARWLWPDAFRGLHVIQFVDNDAARWAVVKGSVRSESGSRITDVYWREEIALRATSWTDRVRSKSNVADAASRFERGALLSLGYEESPVPGTWETAAVWVGR